MMGGSRRGGKEVAFEGTNCLDVEAGEFLSIKFAKPFRSLPEETCETLAVANELHL